MADEDTTPKQAPETDRNKYAHVLDLARAKKASRGELEVDRRPPLPPGPWTPPPGGE